MGGGKLNRQQSSAGLKLAQVMQIFAYKCNGDKLNQWCADARQHLVYSKVIQLIRWTVISNSPSSLHNRETETLLMFMGAEKP